jgi:hypothetical protein
MGVFTDDGSWDGEDISVQSKDQTSLFVEF